MLLFVLFLCVCFVTCVSSTTYDISIHIPFTQGKNPEGITVSKKDKSLLVTGYVDGSLTKDNGNTITTNQFFDQVNVFGQMTGIKTDKKGNIYVCLHSVLNGTNTEFNGVWKIDPTKTPCISVSQNGCQKIFPNFNENVIFPDGVALREEKEDVFVYVSDPSSGNIWTFKDEGLQSKGKLFSGTDALSVPNYLQGFGVIFPLGSDFNKIGRGFGVNGLAYDSDHSKLYAAVAETGTTVVMKLDKNGNMDGPQKVVGNTNFFLKYIFDGIFYSKCKLYVTVIADLSTGELLGGNKILGYDVCSNNASWSVIIDNVLLGTPTDITNGCDYDHPNKNCDNLYIVDIAGFGLSPYGPNVLVAKPSQ